MPIQALEACTIIGLITSTVYVALVAVATHRFGSGRQRTARAGAELPPISVLKAIHGAEPRLHECLESFFRQDYPMFELVFGARDARDEAVEVVQALRAQYPEVNCRIVLCGAPLYPNAKVSALETLLAQASHEYLVMADSDTRVDHDFLRRVVLPLLDQRTGLATCLYRGVPVGTISSRLHALGMSVEMPAGVLVANLLEGMRFALGPAIATRVDVVRAIGGITALAPYCADDFMFGRLVHEAGYAVVVSDVVIEHTVPGGSWAASIEHQVRWMRSTRFSRPFGHIGAGLTFATPFGIAGATIAAAEGHPMLAVAVACWAVTNAVVLCLIVGWLTLRDRAAARWCWLYPVRDLLGFCAWSASFFGRHIVWHGERYELLSGGRMRNATS